MTEQKRFLSAMTILGLLLAIGMSSAAFILGVQAKRAVSGQQTIAVNSLITIGNIVPGTTDLRITFVSGQRPTVLNGL